MLDIYGAPEVVEQRVEHLWRGAFEIVEEDLRRGLQVVLRAPFVDCVTGVLREALANLHLVELDGTFFYVLRAAGCDLNLLGHLEECLIIDAQSEGVALHIIV